MTFTWDKLDYWQSGERQVVRDRLTDLTTQGKLYNPAPHNVFKALMEVPFDKVNVIIVGQDPYPDPELATGIAFDIPSQVPYSSWPPSLRNFLKEYQSDLGLPAPTSGRLASWVEQGVLLWNCIPTCTSWKPLSHDWEEYQPLTKEIITRLSERGGVVFVFLGGRAREFAKYADEDDYVIEASHPSPRALMNKTTRKPFVGSRIFSIINEYLVSMQKEPINWRL